MKDQIHDIINFDKYFPKLINTLNSFEDLIDLESYRDEYKNLKDKSFENVFPIRKKFYVKEDEVILPKFKDELDKILPNDYWNTLYSYSDGSISIHTLNVVYRTIRDPIYVEQYSEYERNIHKWASLLHDICKRGRPLIEGRDHIHPFISGEATLKIFAHLKIIDIKTEEEREAFNEVC